MKFIYKKSILYALLTVTSFLVLIQFSGNNESQVETEAFSTAKLTLTRSMYTIGLDAVSTSYFDYNWSQADDGIPSTNISGQGSFPRSADSTTYIQIRQNVTTTQPGTLGANYRGFWSTTATPGYITSITITPVAAVIPNTGSARNIAPILSSYRSVGTVTVATNTVAPDGCVKEEVQAVMGSQTVVTPVTWNFDVSKMYTYFNLTPNTSHTHYYTSVEITYSIPATDFEASNTFASYFLNMTENKQGSCTTESLKWATIDNTYDTLTASQKEVFLNSSDSNLINARARYQYLRSYNESLTDFLA